jgi:hypothetical protein
MPLFMGGSILGLLEQGRQSISGYLWIEFLLAGKLLKRYRLSPSVKRFTHDERAEYPDYGVNTEVYTEGRFQELELLGPHRVVSSGESLTLPEEWNLFFLDLLDAAIGPRIRWLFAS